MLIVWIRSVHIRSTVGHLAHSNLRQIVDRLSTDLDLRRRCIRALSGTCGLYGILPTSHVFAGKLSKPGQQPFASSITFDVWKLTDEKHRVFAVKSLRVCDGDLVEMVKEV